MGEDQECRLHFRSDWLKVMAFSKTFDRENKDTFEAE